MHWQRANIEIIGWLKCRFYHGTTFKCKPLFAHMIYIYTIWLSERWLDERKQQHRERERHTQQMLVWDHIDISLSTECGHVIIELHSTNFRLHQKTYWNGATNQSAAQERSKKTTTTTNRKSWGESRKELQNGVHLQHHWKTISRTSNRQCYRNHIFKWQIIQCSHRSKFRLLLTKNESKQIKFNERCVVSVLFYLSFSLSASLCVFPLKYNSNDARARNWIVAPQRT